MNEVENSFHLKHRHKIQLPDFFFFYTLLELGWTGFFLHGINSVSLANVSQRF